MGTRDMKGKTALVTGGAQNIGLGIARAFSEAGADVIIADLNPPDLNLPDLKSSGLNRPEQAPKHTPEQGAPEQGLQQIDGRLHFHRTDITSEAAVIDVMEMVRARFSHLDVLINNAGICIEVPLFEMTLSDWHKVMDINVTGVFLMTKHAFPVMTATRSRGGAIVNISSIEAMGANPLHSVYAASKGAVASLTRNTALEYGPYGIRCNAIAPGWVNTPFNEALLDQYPDRGAVDAEIAALHPLGKLGHPADIGATALWLAGDGAQFVNGQMIVVDGGRTAKLPLPKL